MKAVPLWKNGINWKTHLIFLTRMTRIRNRSFFINSRHWLKEAIDSMDYVSMRRYADLEHTIQKIKEYTVKLDSMELTVYEQIDLFSM